MLKESFFEKLTSYMGNKKSLLITSLLLSAISSILGLLPFIFLWLIIKELFKTQPVFDDVFVYAWSTLGTAILSMILYFLSLTCSHLAAFRVEVGMRKVGMRKIINMPLGFFDSRETGKIRKIIDDNTSQTHLFLAHQLPDLASSIISPIIILILMFVIDWKMGLISLIPILLGVITMSFMMTEEGENFRKKYMDHLENMSSEAVEYVRGMPVVKTFGQSVYAFTRFVDSIVKYKEIVSAYTIMWQKPMAFYMIVMHSAAFFLIPFSIFSINENNLMLILNNFIFYLLIAPNFTLLFMRSMYFQNAMSLAKQSLERFDNILDYPQMVFPTNNITPSQFDIEFKNVSFSYKDTDHNAIEDISFRIKEGETLALVGSSGGGKTTIARLLARFWDIQSGEILIGGHNITTLSKKVLMENIALVFQNTKLFNLSIKENIIYGKPNASKEEIARSIDLSQSRDIIEKCPDGLNTRIGKNGIYLSGGEQQRIALARAILKDAPIIILDEATSFADPENEYLIQQALFELSKNKTTLMIAHRLNTVQKADKILVLDKGKIIQEGTHDELISREGLYKTMWMEYQQSIDWKLENTGDEK
ncbi:ATP-binding cassette subfamily B protein [Bisgaardia hudsonensis]|uniref:ATP-binding cassette subfamily B protein n=1 Tax=Bisgaardia hudsonensis TaxID=109472 RepID=A0A4R2MXA3_9PAST|nr:ABC transporter ATP-binding protein [Bisgaardia hudsonensis]QLB12170.1 ABC transporter ATP-binding protein [Bisgaardia hudsonensis]TCP12207.1 ATP-binding cassette subfamily B protein [Bisgaardia hudsonensis]